jgi:hypothetical protein
MGNGKRDDCPPAKFHEPQINRKLCCIAATQQELIYMRRLVFPMVLLLCAQPVSAPRQALGIFGQWGAFDDTPGGRCYAITEPPRTTRNFAVKPFASVGFFRRGGGNGGQVQFRLSRPKRAGSALILRIDDRPFQLVGGGTDAWAPGPEADAAIIAAMRSGIGMVIETRAERGAAIRNYYQLRGAATAIDAAAIACAPRR